MSGAGEYVGLVAAGVLAGAIGSAGGVTSLVSYPALLAVGVPPLPANVANLVAAVACRPGSAPAAGMFVGSAAGPVVARPVPPTFVRGVVGLLGLAFALTLTRDVLDIDRQLF